MGSSFCASQYTGVFSNVDNYKPGKRIPRCQLLAEFKFGSPEAEVVPFHYRVNLIGARKPHNKFTIIPSPSGVSHCVRHLSLSASVWSLATKRSHTPPASAGTYLVQSCTLACIYTAYHTHSSYMYMTLIVVHEMCVQRWKTWDGLGTRLHTNTHFLICRFLT